MSCTCPETNFMDGKGHDLGCPLWLESLRYAVEDYDDLVRELEPNPSTGRHRDMPST